MTDFDRIRHLGDSDSSFPGVHAYLFGSLARMQPTDAWMAAFRAEAAAHGMTVDVRGGLVYLTWPSAEGAS